MSSSHATHEPRYDRFAVLGGGGAIARWHADAIQANAGRVVAVVEPAGLTPERREILGADVSVLADLDGLAGEVEAADEPIDAVVVCTPNHLHAEHVAWALERGFGAVCEKPVALSVEAIDDLERRAIEAEREIHPILQLRHHPGILALRERLADGPAGRATVTVDYRLDGSRLFDRWRADEDRSGGLVFELGIHTLDLVLWLFGPARDTEVLRYGPRAVEARIDLERADVEWRLEVTPPADEGGATPKRELVVDGDRIDLAKDCNGLHRHAYAALLEGRGPELREARASVALASRIRGAGMEIAEEGVHAE
ncbi:MAG: Gfo/Idh/MocA family oxidoreductase [Planctomycetota bacterium]